MLQHGLGSGVLLSSANMLLWIPNDLTAADNWAVCILVGIRCYDWQSMCYTHVHVSCYGVMDYKSCGMHHLKNKPSHPMHTHTLPPSPTPSLCHILPPPQAHWWQLSYLPLIYSVVSMLGVLLMSVCTPLGFSSLFTLLGAIITRPMVKYSNLAII